MRVTRSEPNFSMLLPILELLPHSPPAADLLGRIESELDGIQAAQVEADIRARLRWRMLVAALIGAMAGALLMAGVTFGDPVRTRPFSG